MQIPVPVPVDDHGASKVIPLNHTLHPHDLDLGAHGELVVDRWGCATSVDHSADEKDDARHHTQKLDTTTV